MRLRASYIKWGLVSKLFAWAFPWKSHIKSAFFFVSYPLELNNVIGVEGISAYIKKQVFFKGKKLHIVQIQRVGYEKKCSLNLKLP